MGHQPTLINCNPKSYTTTHMVFTENEKKLRNRQLLNVYNGYRCVLALMFLMATFTQIGQELITFTHLRQFQLFAMLYAGVNIAILLFSRSASTPKHFFVICCLDILLLTLLIFLSGNKSGSLGNLMFIAVAAGNILIAGRAGTLLAAIATIGMISVSSYYTLAQHSPVQGHLNSGVLGILFFATAFSIQYLAARLRRSEEHSMLQRRQYEHLQQLNHSIIQRMRTGILVIDEQTNIVLLNEAAEQLLDYPKKSATLNEVSTELAHRLSEWRQNPVLRGEPFQLRPHTRKIQANFTALEKSLQSDQNLLIFLEDTTLLAQQAQHLKLASLGRLAASIAHEIRNPLGAISHASQLLSESPDLNKSDARLLEIIQNHSVRMNRIIENVQKLSTRKASQPEQFNLNKWLQNYVNNEHIAGYPDAKITLREHQNVMVHMDVDQFSQILNNLCQNGLRYSQRHSGSPTATLEVGLMSDSGHPYLDVIDQGPGMTQEIQDNLFEPFYTTDIKGTGLGLYISKELCEANHASLELINAQQGCHFRITFAHPDKRIH